MKQAPCSATYAAGVKVEGGKGNYYFVGDQIVFDKDMDRMFPSTTRLEKFSDVSA